jgi:selenium-binding protein 1
MRAFEWDGKELKQAFEVDFAKEKLGRAHHMKFSAKSSGKSMAQVARDQVALAGTRKQ